MPTVNGIYRVSPPGRCFESTCAYSTQDGRPDPIPSEGLPQRPVQRGPNRELVQVSPGRIPEPLDVGLNSAAPLRPLPNRSILNSIVSEGTLASAA
jgi:hypothetical protein